MNAVLALILAFLTAGVAAMLLASIALLIMPGTYSKLHYLGFAGIVGSILITVAIVIADGYTQSSVKAVMLTLIVLLSGPAIAHATGRAAKRREEKGWDDE